MIYTRSKISTLFSLFLFTFSTVFMSAQQGGVSPTFFSETLINDILSHRDAAGVRFYNVVASESTTELTSMAIGIRQDGSEINDGLFARKYEVNEGVSGNEGLTKGVSRNTAIDLCAGVTAQNLVSFSADFSKEILQNMINVKDANGIQLVQATSAENATFEVSSAELSNGSWTSPKAAESSTCTDPCPSYCDADDSKYVNR